MLSFSLQWLPPLLFGLKPLYAKLGCHLIPIRCMRDAMQISNHPSTFSSVSTEILPVANSDSCWLVVLKLQAHHRSNLMFPKKGKVKNLLRSYHPAIYIQCQLATAVMALLQAGKSLASSEIGANLRKQLCKTLILFFMMNDSENDEWCTFREGNIILINLSHLQNLRWGWSSGLSPWKKPTSVSVSVQFLHDTVHGTVRSGADRFPWGFQDPQPGWRMAMRDSTHDHIILYMIIPCAGHNI